MNGLVVEAVTPGSIGEEMGVEPGDRLLSVNHHPLRDIIDYSYHTAADDELLLEVAKPDGEVWELEIEREPGEPLGLTFPAPEPARCRTHRSKRWEWDSPRTSDARSTNRADGN